MDTLIPGKKRVRLTVAVGGVHLSAKVLRWVTAPRREAACRHSALTRACSRLRREAQVCAEIREQERHRESKRWAFGWASDGTSVLCIVKRCCAATLWIAWVVPESTDVAHLRHGPEIVCTVFFHLSSLFPSPPPPSLPLAVGMFSQETTTTGKSWAGKEIEQTSHEWNSYPMWTLEGVLIAQPPGRGGTSGDFEWPPILGSWRFRVLSLTSCSLRRRASHTSESPRAFHKLSASPWLMLPACSNCSRSRELTRPRATHLGEKLQDGEGQRWDNLFLFHRISYCQLFGTLPPQLPQFPHSHIPPWLTTNKGVNVQVIYSYVIHYWNPLLLK